MNDTESRKAGQNADYTMYLVTDRKVMTAPTLEATVEQAILGGCTMVQLREKSISTCDFYSLAGKIKAITDKYHIPLIINDRIDIALATGAAGVHLGQSDMPASVARKMMGDNMILGISASTKEEAEKAVDDGADYLGVGAVYPTVTKKDAKIVTLRELEEIRKQISIPVVAIGGINRNNAAALAQTGIDGLAVVSAIAGMPDIRTAAMELKTIFTRKAGGNTRIFS